MDDKTKQTPEFVYVPYYTSFVGHIMEDSLIGIKKTRTPENQVKMEKKIKVVKKPHN